MIAENTVLYKSYAFAQRIVKLHKLLLKQKQPRALAERFCVAVHPSVPISKRLLVGFRAVISRPNAALPTKEARETHYWLRLLRDTECLEPRLAESLIEGAEELKRMLAAILLSTRNDELKEEEPPYFNF